MGDEDLITAEQLRAYSRGAEAKNDIRFAKNSDVSAAIATLQAQIDYIAMMSNIDLEEM